LITDGEIRQRDGSDTDCRIHRATSWP